jgi:hypothetical protein
MKTRSELDALYGWVPGLVTANNIGDLAAM